MGRIIVKPDDESARRFVAEAFRYLWRSPSARRLLREYQRQGGHIHVVGGDDPHGGSSEAFTGNITWSPTNGIATLTGVQSPALVLLHEIAHTVHFHNHPGKEIKAIIDEKLLQLAVILNGPDKALAATEGRWTPEEERVTQIEGKVARELGEPVRLLYNDGEDAPGLASVSEHHFAAKG